MEESVGDTRADLLQEIFDLPEMDPLGYGPLELAFIGDGIYNLIIRTLVMGKGSTSVQALHEKSRSLVNAAAQSKMMRTIQGQLTEEEHAIYKRGRNAKSVTPAKNQSVTDYRRSTGFEALLGYLYLKKEDRRLVEIVKIGLDALEKEEEDV